MERTTIKEAKEIFCENFLGPVELQPMFERLGLKGSIENYTDIPYSKERLVKLAKDNYILVYAIEKVGTTLINIMLFRDSFGVEPKKSEPCMYNQDWYLAEDFILKPVTSGWHLIMKDVFEDSRAVMPFDLISKNIKFPTAILCTYTFFAFYYANRKFLWFHDFVWCEDTDHNGDRIYVGKYHDIDGLNNNGFSIHRHLSLRPCYGAISVL